MSTRIPTLADVRSQDHGADPGAVLEAAAQAEVQHIEAAEQIDKACDGRRMEASEQRQFDAHIRQADELRYFIQQTRSGNVRQHRSQYGGQQVGGSSDSPASFGGSTRDQAKRTLDALHRSGSLPDHAAEKAENLVAKQGTSTDQNMASRWVVAAGSEHYRSAFTKMLADSTRGHMLWTAQEQDAYRAVTEVQAEMRAMGESTGGPGGFMVPIQLDPAIMLTNAGSANPLRRISRVVQTVGAQWKGLTSAGVTTEWLSADSVAARAMADASPTVAEVNIPVYVGDAYVPYSYEVGMDAVDFQNQITTLMLDAADVMQATAYTVGTGVGQPKGLITALVAAGGSTVVASTTADVFAAADVFKVQNALPPRFQPRAQWAANLAIINAARQFETTAGALKFPELENDRLLRRPIDEISDMDGVVDAAANNYLLAYGDFSQFVIADRIGSTIEFVQNVMDQATGRPSGRRGLILWFRTGSDVTVPNAFRLLNS
jgi:HK97 family phage major capsid protein